MHILTAQNLHIISEYTETKRRLFSMQLYKNTSELTDMADL